ncbi:MAG: molybdopterin adenylyltransferase [Chloroflexi bacterium]|nr:molybdopterin adenylyltransferase [Chloroflexota bacterium]
MIRVGILTVSDKGFAGEREDKSGEEIRRLVGTIEAEVVRYDIVPDERELIEQKLREWSDGCAVDLILTTGGTGLSPRDVTPEATLAIVDRLVPGIAEVMRQESLKKTPFAMLSRAAAGIRRSTLIVNLPGSPKSVRENLQSILAALPHGIEKLKGDPTECGQP